MRGDGPQCGRPVNLRGTILIISAPPTPPRTTCSPSSLAIASFGRCPRLATGWPRPSGAPGMPAMRERGPRGCRPPGSLRPTPHTACIASLRSPAACRRAAMLCCPPLRAALAVVLRHRAFAKPTTAAASRLVSGPGGGGRPPWRPHPALPRCVPAGGSSSTRPRPRRLRQPPATLEAPMLLCYITPPKGGGELPVGDGCWYCCCPTPPGEHGLCQAASRSSPRSRPPLPPPAGLWARRWQPPLELLETYRPLPWAPLLMLWLGFGPLPRPHVPPVCLWPFRSPGPLLLLRPAPCCPPAVLPVCPWPLPSHGPPPLLWPAPRCPQAFPLTGRRLRRLWDRRLARRRWGRHLARSPRKPRPSPPRFSQDHRARRASLRLMPRFPRRARMDMPGLRPCGPCTRRTFCCVPA